MKILNFGSLNLDHVYQMPHFVRAGETLSSTAYQQNVGGKGLNQSVALAKAGAEVYHAGLIGTDGDILKSFLADNGVDTRYVHTIDCPTGNAIIQVEPAGNNCILLYGGANQCVSPAFIDEVLSGFDAGDYLVLQNEINSIDRIIEKAHAHGMQVVLNPSPIDESLQKLPLEKVSWFILNEIEGEALSGENDPQKMPAALSRRFPHARVVLTLGGAGSVYTDGQVTLKQAAYRVKAVDTTAAGDTFTGYFLSAVATGIDVAAALHRASKAAAISVTRPGAGASIPRLEEVLAELENE